MKKHLFLVFAVFSVVLFAQHPCSFNKQLLPAGTQSVSVSFVQLENKYDAKFHHLNLNLERTNKTVSGYVRTLATVMQATDTFAFELYNALIIDSIRLNGTNKNPIRNQHEVRVPIGTTLNAGASIDAFIYYHGTAPTINGSAIGDGLNNKTSTTWGNQITYSLSQPYSAYEWWPCKQQLKDKLDSSWVYVTTDSTNKVGSNGLLKNVITLGNKKRYEWKSKNVIDYYLISVAVGKYVDYTFYAHPSGTSDSVMVQNYIYDNPATLPNFKNVIDQTDDLIELFSDLFGLYPFANEKYGHAMCPFGGGMEHQTMTSLGSFNFTLVAHELAHQWWGDNVTCKTWHDIYVNEGLASYSEQLALEYLDPTNAASNMSSVHTNVMSAPDGSVYNPDTSNVSRIFSSRLSYDKGCAITHSIRFELNNDTVFYQFLKSYQSLFGNNTAGIQEYKTLLENTSGMNFTQFFNQWIYGEGYPTFNVKWNQIGNQFMIQSTQSVSFASVTPLFMTSLEYKLTRSGLPDTIIRVFHGTTISNHIVTVNGTVTNVSVDPNNWILNKVSGVSKDTNLNLVGITTYDFSNYNLFPNPCHDVLFIKNTGDTLKRVHVYDVIGNEIISLNIGNNYELNTSQLNQGIYYLLFESNTKPVKFVVSHP
jgi:aminopeptidase N